MYKKIIENIKDKNICILGFGREGISTYNFIRKHLKEKFITIIDKKDISSSILKDDKNVKLIYGDNYLDNLGNYDLIIKTPGISLNGINIDNIKNKITSQLELTLEVFKSNVIGVTGTKGKSTTSTLLYNILKNEGLDVYLLGNIGTPIFDYVENYKEDTYLVIEMSALQLEYVNVSPHIGIVLNLFEDHLDFAKTVKHYHECKMNMFKFQTKEDYAIYSLDNLNIVTQVKNNNYLGKMYKVTLNDSNLTDTIYIKDDSIIFNDQVISSKNLKRNIIGDHNLSNIMFCLVVAKILNLNISNVCTTISNFNPLRHRMELVGTFDDVTYYNDSIATIPMSTISAIKTLKDVDTLIFGGMDRNIDYSEFIDFLNKSDISNLICMPTTGYKIGKEIEKVNDIKNIYYIESLEEAVKKAKIVTKKGKICLMSPAASSYEYFKNFEEKGDMFIKYVKES